MSAFAEYLANDRVIRSLADYGTICTRDACDMKTCATREDPTLGRSRDSQVRSSVLVGTNIRTNDPNATHLHKKFYVTHSADRQM